MMFTTTRPEQAPADITAAVNAVLGDTARPVQLHEPYFGGNENRYTQSCIDEGWVSSVGSFVDRFERELAAYCGAAHAVVVVNGTCALQVALVARGVQPGDEVLVPSLTFVATANSVVHAGAVPHFVEVEEQSLGIDPKALASYLKSIVTMKDGQAVNEQTGRIIRALVPVHIFGHPCQLEALQSIADQYNMLLVEDATEALGSAIGKQRIGSHGTAVFSFNGNKIITTGGGGAIVTQDMALAKRIKHLTTTAKQPHAWAFEHDAIAWNYRMPNLNAALGCAQLEQLPTFLAAKRALAMRYTEMFAGMPSLRILPEPEGCTSNFWLTTLIADTDDAQWRDTHLAQLHAAQLMCRPIWTPMHLLPMYAQNPRSDMALTESLQRRIISLPSSVKLGLALVEGNV